MKNKSVEDTALILSILLNRSNERRARVSEKTIKKLAGRTYIRNKFIGDLIEELSSHSWIMFELESGGYGTVHVKALEEVDEISSRTLFSKEERKAIKSVDIDWNLFSNDIDMNEDEDEDEE